MRQLSEPFIRAGARALTGSLAAALLSFVLVEPGATPDQEESGLSRNMSAAAGEAGSDSSSGESTARGRGKVNDRADISTSVR